MSAASPFSLLQNARPLLIRYARFYLQLLLDLNRRYVQGEPSDTFLGMLYTNWAQIRHAFEWARDQANADEEARAILTAFQREGEPLFSLAQLPAPPFHLEAKLQQATTSESQIALRSELIHSCLDRSVSYLVPRSYERARQHCEEQLNHIDQMLKSLTDQKLDAIHDLALVYEKLGEHRLAIRMHKQICHADSE